MENSFDSLDKFLKDIEPITPDQLNDVQRRAYEKQSRFGDYVLVRRHDFTDPQIEMISYDDAFDLCDDTDEYCLQDLEDWMCNTYTRALIVNHVRGLPLPVEADYPDEDSGFIEIGLVED
jgi:hypothetical protein